VHLRLSLRASKTHFRVSFPEIILSFAHTDPLNRFCGIHITQFQKQDPSKDNYKITVAVKDAANPPIQVGSNSYIDAPTDFHVFTQTLLGPAIEVIPGAVDDDPLRFSYNGNEWDSNNGNCKVGNYDAGIRMIDCGFDC
jgi:hypothetical protein